MPKKLHPMVERLKKIEEKLKDQKGYVIPGKYAQFTQDEDEDEDEDTRSERNPKDTQ